MTLTERAGGLLFTRARRGGLTATVAATLVATLTATLASWARGWGDGCFSVKDEEDDDDKDDDQDTKKQHSTRWGHLWRHTVAFSDVPPYPPSLLEAHCRFQQILHPSLVEWI